MVVTPQSLRKPAPSRRRKINILCGNKVRGFARQIVAQNATTLITEEFENVRGGEIYINFHRFSGGSVLKGLVIKMRLGLEDVFETFFAHEDEFYNFESYS